MQCNIKPASKSKGKAAVSPAVHDTHCVRPGPCVRRRVPLQQAAPVLHRQHLISKFRAMANPSRPPTAARRAQLHAPNALLAKRHLGNTFIMQCGNSPHASIGLMPGRICKNRGEEKILTLRQFASGAYVCAQTYSFLSAVYCSGFPHFARHAVLVLTGIPVQWLSIAWSL